MAYYAIGIGGTGAKCLESLIHLARGRNDARQGQTLYPFC